MPRKYSINWEDDKPVSFEIDGVSYASLDDVPDAKDRRKLEAMLDSSETEDEFDEEFDGFKDFDQAEFEKNVREAQESGDKAFKLVTYIFTGVAVLMLLIAGISVLFILQKTGREQSADGLVTNLVEMRKYVNQEDRVVENYYYPVVRFTPSDGKVREIQLNEGSNPPAYEIGDRVTILYEPGHPLDARIKSVGGTISMWLLPAITGFLGLIFGGIVFGFTIFMPSKEMALK
jgi:hypothetical protein